MAYQYTFNPVAAREYEDALNWYEQKNIIAADNFIVAVQDAITAVLPIPTDTATSTKIYGNLP